MKSTRCPQARWRVSAACGLAAAGTLSASGATAGPAPDPSRPERQSIVAAIPEKAKVNPSFGSLPISFEPNVGQAPAGVKFLTRGSAAALTSTGAVLGGGATPVTLDFVGASTASRAAGAGELPGKANYLTGNDPSKWRTNVPTYESVRVEQLYPGVDLVWYGKGGSLEYDLVVASGTDPNSIAFELEGFPSPELEADGALVAGSVRLERPFAYQEVDGARQAVASRFVLRQAGRVGFELGDYDRSLPLVIDPEIRYSYSVADAAKDFIVSGVTVDSTGAAYVVGSIAPAGTGLRDVYIAKINAEGTGLVYSTTIGGARFDIAYDVAVDSAGSAFVTGETTSGDFPTTAGAFQAAFASANSADPDAFVLKLSPAGDAPAYSTYLGGAKFDHGRDIVIDAPGNAYVTGTTTSTNFPTTEPEQAGNGGLADAFMTIVNPTGNARVSSTYLGGSGSENGEGIAIDPAGNVTIVGATFSTNFPVTPGALQPTFGGGLIDGFWAKYNPAGQRIGSTYLGGSGDDLARAVAVDAAGNTYVTGETDVTDFPVASPSRPKIAGGSRDAFVAELNPGGTALEFSIFFGGSEYESGNAIALNSAGHVFVVGDTYSNDVTLVDPVQVTFGGGLSDAFLLECDPDAQGSDAIQFCTYLGQERAEFGNDCGVGPNDEVCVASTSPDLSPDGSENDDGSITQYSSSGPIPVTDLFPSNSESDIVRSPGRTDLAVHVFIFIKDGQCSDPAPFGATFSVEIPPGLRFVSASGSPGVRVTSRPPLEGNGLVTFEYPEPIEGVHASSTRGTVNVYALGVDAAPDEVFAFRNRVSPIGALDCNPSDNTRSFFINLFTGQESDGSRSLELDPNVDPGTPPGVRLLNNLDTSGSGHRVVGRGAGVQGYRVYTSTQPGVQPIPSNLFASIPPGQTRVDVTQTPAGSFFVVTSVDESGESPPSNEVGGTLPVVSKLKVSASKIVAEGTGFGPGLQVFFGGLSFATAAKLKKANTKIVQKGLLVTGQSIGAFSDAFLGPGSTILVYFVNANGFANAKCR